MFILLYAYDIYIQINPLSLSTIPSFLSLSNSSPNIKQRLEEIRRLSLSPSSLYLLCCMSLSNYLFSLLPWKQAFWAWSWDELATYDLPATVDFVFERTGKKIHYVGHSMVEKLPNLLFSLLSSLVLAVETGFF